MPKSSILGALTLSVSLALTGCGSGSADTTAPAGSAVSATEHNDADVAFASGMIQHHAQALAMVDTTMGRDLDPEVAALADDVRAAQVPEIETMADWLTSWGEEIPETVRDHANSHHGTEHSGAGEGAETGMDLPGMMTAEDMERLGQVSDARFQDLWLEMMIEHHEGAIEMAEAEQADGQFRRAVELARTIKATQTAEIERMRELRS